MKQRAQGLCRSLIAPITIDFSKPLTADELAVISVLVNPQLKALRARQGVADAQVFDAGLLPDPVLAAGLGKPTSGQSGLVDAYNLGLSWDIMGLVTRSAARRSAQSHLTQVRYDIAWQEWMVANRARQEAYRLTFMHARYRLATIAAKTASGLLDQSRRSFKRRDITIDVLALREVAYLDATNRAAALRRTIEKTRLDLNKTLGLPPDETVVVAQSESLDAPKLDAAALFEKARSQRLDLLALQAGYQSQEYQLQRDLLAQYPKINLGFQQARDTGNVTTIGLSASITLPILNGGKGAVAIARATRAQLRAEYEARLFQTRSDIATLVGDIGQIGLEAEPLKRQLPALQRAEAAMRGAVANGDVTLVSYETVRSNLLAKQLQLSSLEQSKADQQIALHLATGVPWNEKERGCERPSY